MAKFTATASNTIGDGMDACLNLVPQASKDAQFLMGLPPEQQPETLLRWLVGRQHRRREFATDLVRRMGDTGTSLVAGAVVKPRTSSQTRLKLLEVIDAIGRPLPLGRWHQLGILLHRTDRAVQLQILKVLRRCRPVGPSSATPAGPRSIS